MTDALYATRLRWSNGGGVAKLHGRAVALTAAPVLGGVAVHFVDYTPEVHCVEIRRRACDPVGEMTDGAKVAKADAENACRERVVVVPVPVSVPAAAAAPRGL